MKKLLVSFMVTLGIVSFLPVTALAAPTPTQSLVAGTVTYKGSPVSGATVTVKCDGNTLVSPPTTIAGAYGVEFTPETLCPAGDTAHVTAVKGSENGSNSATVNSTGDPDLNIVIIPISIALPEMGVLTSFVAGVGAVGAFLVIRRRNLGANTK